MRTSRWPLVLMIVGVVICVVSAVGAYLAGNLLDEQRIELPDGLLPFALAAGGGLILLASGVVGLLITLRRRW